MLKKFFISMLGTMAGLWISLILLFFAGMMLVVAVAGDSDTPSLKKRTILRLPLEGDIEERYQPSSVMDLIYDSKDSAPSLDELLRALRAAADDRRIDGVFLDCQGASMGYASRQELLQALRDFKVNSGKPVYAYADNYAQGDYILASAADSIFLNPMGAVDIHGVGGSTPFFKNALDKLGVKMQIIKVGTFKSAVEPFILSSMSEPARLQMQQYCDSLWGFAVDAIAANRDLAPDSLVAWAPEMMFTMPAEVFVQRGLVHGLVYRREFDNKLRALTDRSADQDLRMIDATDYLAAAGDLSSTVAASRSHVAVYYAFGDIVDNGKEGISGEVVVPDIIALADDSNVAGLVLRVNSGGGSAFASEQIWEALEYFKSTGKPFYVSMGDYAASGGYYISCGADRIYADATTITGSIGVFGMIPDLSGLVSGKLGVDFSTVQTNPNAAGISLFEPMTPEQHAAMQRSVEQIYDTFTGRVATGRDLPVDSVRAIAEGRVWVGSRAIQLGLVDVLGSLNTAVNAMTSELSLDRTDVVAYPATEEDRLVQLLRSSLNSEMGGASALGEFDAQTLEYMRYLRRLRDMNPMQARMEKIVIE